MKLKKFTAPTTREALQKLRAELGEDAIILSTKQTAAGTEVLAASSQDLDVVTEKPATAASVAPASWTRADRAQLAPQESPRQPTAAEKVAQQVAAQRDVLIKKAPAVQHALPAGAPREFAPDDMISEVAKRRSQAASESMVSEQTAVLEEIKQMRQLLKDQMAIMTWRDSLEKNPQRGELWNLLTQSGFSPLFARTLVDKLPVGLTETQMQDWAMTVIKKNLNVVPAERDIVETGGTFALVGPTGVGKTTTTAKLAARCVVKYGADSLGLITTDSYRIGAQDQLRIYGKILGVQVYTAQTHADLAQLRSSMQRKRLILIDTVGMGQRDSRVAEQTKILTDSHVKRVLLLNATSQPETLDDVVRHYKSTGLSGAILSKLDEAIKIGGVLDVVMRHKLALHYIATGQRVPEDLFPADPRVLVHRALRSRSSQAFQTSSEELKWKMAQVSTTGL
ncbi:flagellar biosynthesis protein FlhF [Limnobacter parvus]|uniref:Flagellar biosynthesis protein FlhF n=1 Tax=Limnobacter parvus TaxID=2939690 RepID=A0ABT1XGM5_9BURK|nr:flagellar biosynthesis protein FlhF [Limnobacter parvus]MCR2746427.1 flagellar biosynthesis protein FlhF [Limnobacter parvus]